MQPESWNSILGWFSLVAAANATAGGIDPDDRGVALGDELPVVSIAYAGDPTAAAFEDAQFIFSLSRTGDAQNALSVTVAVAESGDMIDAANEGHKTVTFDVGETTTTFTAAVIDDIDDEPHNTVAVLIRAAAHYAVSSEDSASVRIRDDDGALIELTLDPPNRIVDEGETAVFDLVATAVDDGTFETADDFARVFGRDVANVAWSTRSMGRGHFA